MGGVVATKKRGGIHAAVGVQDCGWNEIRALEPEDGAPLKPSPPHALEPGPVSIGQEISVLESKLNLLRADGAHKAGIAQGMTGYDRIPGGWCSLG